MTCQVWNYLRNDWPCDTDECLSHQQRQIPKIAQERGETISDAISKEEISHMLHYFLSYILKDAFCGVLDFFCFALSVLFLK